jgi:hypothetical protein
MLFFVTLPNGSIIDIDLDSTDKVRDIILIMDKSDKILSLGLIDNFHLWYQSDTGYKLNLMEDLNRTIGECGITLNSKIYMQVKYTNLLEIAMKNRLIPDFEKEVEKIQKRFRGNQVREALREEYPDFFDKKTTGWIIFKSPVDMASHNSIARRKKVNNPPKNTRMLEIPLKYLGTDIKLLLHNEDVIKQGGFASCPKNNYNGNYSADINFTPDEFISNIIYKPTEEELKGEWRCEVWVAPGASLELIKQKINEGFKIEFIDDKKLSSKIRSQNSVPWLDRNTLSLIRKTYLIDTLQSHLDDEELHKHKIHGNSKSIAKKNTKDHLMKVYSLYSTKAEGGGKKSRKKSRKNHGKIRRFKCSKV